MNTFYLLIKFEQNRMGKTKFWTVLTKITNETKQTKRTKTNKQKNNNKKQNETKKKKKNILENVNASLADVFR